MASQSVGNELSPFLLKVPGLEEAAEREEKEAMRGSYGFVFKVTVEGVECIAKKLHSAFLERSRVSARERESVTTRFRNECIILSKLRHPNLVQFVGVHFGPKGLTLIMESLRSDLDDFLSDNPQVPLSLKLSMLRDVSYGLVYLHDERTPAIIHRDLTARNILIADNCQAKIADLGMAKVVTLQEQIAQSHTQAPGQVLYMPPEAMKERAECTPKLDIFSFGHLSLFTMIQDYPKVYNVAMTMDMQKNGISERLKRQRSLDLVGSDHCLYPIITECLYDRPEQRPTTRDLNSRLIKLSTQHPVSARQVMPYTGEEIARLQDLLIAEEKITSYVNLIKSMREQIGEAQTLADVYKAYFEVECADREKAQEELDGALAAIGAIATFKSKIEALVTERDDLMYDIQQRKKFKNDNKKAHDKLKEQLSQASRTVLSQHDQIESLRREKKVLAMNLKKAEDQIKDQMKKVTNAEKNTSSTTYEATKAELLHESESNSKEALLKEIDELKDDTEYQKDVIKSLRSIIKGEDDSSLTVSENASKPMEGQLQIKPKIREAFHANLQSEKQGAHQKANLPAWSGRNRADAVSVVQAASSRPQGGHYQSSQRSHSLGGPYQSSGQFDNYSRDWQYQSSGQQSSGHPDKRSYSLGGPYQSSGQSDSHSRDWQYQSSGQPNQSQPSGHPDRHSRSQGGHCQSSGQPDQSQPSGHPDRHSRSLGGHCQSSGQPDQSQPSGHPDQHSQSLGGHCQSSGQSDNQQGVVESEQPQPSRNKEQLPDILKAEALSEDLSRAGVEESPSPAVATYPLDKQERQGEPPDSRPQAGSGGAAGGKGRGPKPETKIHNNQLQQSINHEITDIVPDEPREENIVQEKH